MMAESQNSGTNKVAIARQLCGKRASAAVNKRATIENLLEAMFSMPSLPRVYSEDEREKLVRSWRAESAVIILDSGLITADSAYNKYLRTIVMLPLIYTLNKSLPQTLSLLCLH
jgi:hypothetical protein